MALLKLLLKNTKKRIKFLVDGNHFTILVAITGHCQFIRILLKIGLILLCKNCKKPIVFIP